ncbi:MAG: hypothetical protein K2K69_00780 [Muribaculaceae bacterium]|nr:hypothetical protein [Muribaculaceae bacterium]
MDEQAEGAFFSPPEADVDSLVVVGDVKDDVVAPIVITLGYIVGKLAVLLNEGFDFGAQLGVALDGDAAEVVAGAVICGKIIAGAAQVLAVEYSFTSQAEVCGRFVSDNRQFCEFNWVPGVVSRFGISNGQCRAIRET